MKPRQHRTIQILRDAFFPGTCINCGIILMPRHRFDKCSELEQHLAKCLCLRCRRRLRIINWSKCACQNSNHSSELLRCDFCKDFDDKPNAVFSCFSFHEPMNRMVRELKYKRRRNFAHWFVDLMWMTRKQKILKLISDHQLDTLCFVPMTKGRKFKRGYNQAELIAQEIEKRTELTTNSKLLKRIKKVTPQVRVEDVALRYQNIKDAFSANDCAGKRILLVDDVMTTGSTLAACTTALRNGGAEHVVSLTVATAANFFSSQYLVDEEIPKHLE